MPHPRASAGSPSVPTGGRRGWVAVAAAGRQAFSVKGRAFAALSCGVHDPWAWAEEARSRFERLAFDALGARGAGEWIELEIDRGCSRMALLARSWGERELAAFDLLERAGREALSDLLGDGCAWGELPGSDWGRLDPRQAGERARPAILAWDESASLRGELAAEGSGRTGAGSRSL